MTAQKRETGFAIQPYRIFFMTYKEEINQSIETDTELTQTGESADRDIKRSILTIPNRVSLALAYP